MKKYKVTLTAEHCLYVRKWIEGTLSEDVNIRANTASLITVAALAEVALVLRKKEVVYSRQYKITLSPVQAFALCFLYETLPEDRTNHFINRMMQINNEILQTYSI
ncbi:MAG TPA: hypothetical protein DIT07_12795 [Sphingobacteriaceae bacterium]|nr:hypothetical protein [Sphingobacteriaceae bacterium]